MRLLLDTHVALWSVAASNRLPPSIAQIIRNGANETYVSAASIWEISIKFALAKRNSPPFDGRVAISSFREIGFRILSITAEHAGAVDDLPSIHSDPFDRIIVAQALTEQLRLVSQDAKVAAYSDSFIIW